MYIKKLWIKKYHQFVDKWVIFDSEEKISDIQQEIFGKTNYTLFSGENGAGKTTILSFVAYSFRFLQRFRERMPSDFEIHYEIFDKRTRHSIILSMLCGEVFIIVDNSKKKYVQAYDQVKKRYIVKKNIVDEQVTYDEIKKYLPSIVYAIGFDTMYGKLEYGSNYIGDRRVEYRDISASYRTTNMGAYNSAGILYLYYKMAQSTKLKKMLNSCGFELAPYVDIKINATDEEHPESPYYKYYWKECPIDEEENLRLYNESGLKEYLLGNGGYNDRLNIVSYLKKKSNYLALEKLINKRIVYINEYYIRKENIDIPIKQMSTGEKAFLYDLFSICANVKGNAVIIWEEPETHLNIKWSKKLIPMMTELFSDFDAHFLLSSHSPYMIRNLFQSQIICLKDGMISHPEFNTFLANDIEISNKLFDDVQRSSIEEMVVNYIKNHPEKKTELFKILGESYLRFMLFKSLGE